LDFILLSIFCILSNYFRGIYPEYFRENEWEFFIGSVVTGTETQATLPMWATPDRKESYLIFANAFPRLITKIKPDDNSTWADWGNTLECEKEFPARIKTQITPFQRLLVVQVFRPDRLESAMTLFVCESLGKRNISPPPISLKRLYQDETSPTEPILFVKPLNTTKKSIDHWSRIRSK
jgi:dynein heavy chain 2, cytosolic